MTTKITGENVTDGTILNIDVNPSAIDPNNTEINNLFNIGVIGFKMAVNEGLTVFNLVDGVVDEFNSESGVDTAENVNAAYDSSNDFYANQGTNIPLPSPLIGRTSVTSTGPSTYTVESGITAVNVLVVGGGGGGGAGGYERTKGGGAGAGGLIYYPDYPVTPGGSIAVVVGAGGEGGGYLPPAPGSTPYTPTARPDSRAGTGEFGGYEHPQYTYPGHTYYTPGQTGTDSSFGPLIGEGGGAGGGYLTAGSHPYMGGLTGPQYHSGGSGGAAGGSGSGYTPGSAGETSTQLGNHPIPLTPSILPVNSPGSFGNDGGINQTDTVAPNGYASSGGGGAGGAGGDAEGDTGGEGGIGLNYNIADGSTSVGYAGGGAGGGDTAVPQGTSVPFGGGDTNPTGHSRPVWYPGLPGAVGSGGGGAGGRNIPPYPQPAGGALGGDGGSGIVVIAESRYNVSNTSMTLISDTFTASSTPTTARIVVFAELPDGLSDFTISATRDNTTFNAITLTDTGYVAGSSGTKIYTGSTPLTGTASPQVQLRWKIVGSSLTGHNKIHGVSLQWA